MPRVAGILFATSLLACAVQVTRQILGNREQKSSSESSFILTATIQ